MRMSMKTQISRLRSGIKNQILNPEIDYTKLPQATSHLGHSGSSHADVEEVWRRVVSENPETIRIMVKDVEVVLQASWSTSRKSVNYWGDISKDDLDKFHLRASGDAPSITIQCANNIVVWNGKNNFTHVCPSLIEIL